MTLALPARAKVNLNLKVIGRRPDGYHDIETKLQAISLHDLLIARHSDATRLEGEGLPEGPENLVLKAAALLEHAVGRPLPTEFTLVKRIPTGAGFGGGSSNAAAALRLLTSLHGIDIDLHPLARQLGADVAFFLRGGAAVARGRGDELRATPFVPRWFALAWPGFELSTRAVYGAWSPGLEAEPNSLTTAACAVEPRLAKFIRSLGEGWQMSGSGSGFFRPAVDQASAQAALSGLDCWTKVVFSVPAWG